MKRGDETDYKLWGNILNVSITYCKSIPYIMKEGLSPDVIDHFVEILTYLAAAAVGWIARILRKEKSVTRKHN